MSRRRAIKARDINPDVRYGDLVVAKMINTIMFAGKKSVAEAIVYKAFNIIQNKYKQSPIEVFRDCVSNVRPAIEVRSRRIGGATYQVPVDVRDKRSQALALRWIIQYARNRSEKTMEERLAAEIFDAYNNKGSSIKKREDTHKMAEANRAFSHFKW